MGLVFFFPLSGWYVSLLFANIDYSLMFHSFPLKLRSVGSPNIVENVKLASL